MFNIPPNKKSGNIPCKNIRHFNQQQPNNRDPTIHQRILFLRCSNALCFFYAHVFVRDFFKSNSQGGFDDPGLDQQPRKRRQWRSRIATDFVHWLVFFLGGFGVQHFSWHSGLFLFCFQGFGKKDDVKWSGETKIIEKLQRSLAILGISMIRK